LEVFFEDSRLGQAFESDRELRRRFGKPGGGLDWTKVTAVVVTDVVDPH
jgi:hypothetical protein